MTSLLDGIGDYIFPHISSSPSAERILLGQGKFSRVYLAEKNGKQYAIKETALYPHRPEIGARLMREPLILAELGRGHPNLIEVGLHREPLCTLLTQCATRYMKRLGLKATHI